MKIKWFYKCMLLSLVLIGLKPQYVMAEAQKDISVELKNDYTSCSFKLEFERPGEYSAVLVSPDNYSKEPITTSFSKIDDSNMICNISKCKAGNYTVSIIDPLAETPQDICKVKVLTEATKEKEADVVDSIRVGKDISGLKLFFIDNELNVTWTDNSCGNVAVQVVNTATNEIISNENVKDKIFTCDIPESIDTITVSVVPAVSSKIQDAIQNFNIQIEREPKGNVSFEDIEYTNKDTIKASIDIQDVYGCEVYVNDKKALTNELLKPGTYDFEIPLSNENNNIVFYLVDEKGNKYSFQKTVIQDTICPTLTLEEEYDGIQTKDSKISIVGKISDYDSFSVNDKEFTDISTDGQFTVPCDLHLGENKIVLKAIDKAGNEITYSANICMLEQKKMPVGIVILIAFILILIIAIILINKKIKANEEISIDEEDDDELEEQESVDEDVDELDYVPDEIDSMDYTFDDEDNENNEEGEEEEMTLDEYEEMQRNNKKKKSTKSEYIRLAVFCFVLFLFLKFVINICIIPTESMEETIKAGDIVLINDFAYFKDKPQRGDIVVFKSDEFKIKMNKRVIGLPGDNITFEDGYVYVNGEKLDETMYLNEDVETNSLKTFVVPTDSYFMLGDNREHSDDSRFWNEPYIKANKIKGKVFFIIPVTKITTVLAK